MLKSNWHLRPPINLSDIPVKLEDAPVKLCNVGVEIVDAAAGENPGSAIGVGISETE